MKKAIWILGSFTVIFITWFYFFGNTETAEGSYSFVEITRGNISSTITSSGTMDAVSTVEVGTQVSGKLDKIYVDFNDNVKRGQLLAVLDTTFLAASVGDAKASLERVTAQYKEAKAKHELNKKLYEKGMISELDFIISETSVVTSSASVRSAKSALERAETNLDYAFIRSPINGTIIHRNIEEGQTVAASLSAPQLFIIAEDLSKMEILVNVDESDIGKVKNGQKAIFTVQAFDQKEFTGYVKQIRLQPKTVSNVVNYTVVVNAENRDGLLLPGMTATVDFYIDEKANVMLIPAAALRFSPPEEVVTAFREKMRARMEARADTSRQQNRQGERGDGQGRQQGRGLNSGGGRPNFSGFDRSSFGTLWYFDENNELAMTNVFLGLTDGKNTEIVRGRNVTEGMKIVSGFESPEKLKTSEQPRGLPPGGFGRGFR